MKFSGYAALVVLLSGLVFGCSDITGEDAGRDGKGKATVVFKITDAPFPAGLVEEAWVTIDWIKVLKSGMENMYNEDEPESDKAPFVMVALEEPSTFNLLELRNGITAILAEMELPAGSYSEIRMHIVDAGILLKNGQAFPLKVPSGDASGLKIKLLPELVLQEDAYAEVLFDFDVSRSFIMTGNSKNIQGFIFKPVVRAIAHVETEAGEIAGTVKDADGVVLENVTLKLFKGDDLVTTALTSEEGYYAMIGILPGTYMLVLQVEEYIYQVEVLVEAGKTTITDFVIGEDDNDGEEGSDEEEEGNGEG